MGKSTFTGMLYFVIARETCILKAFLSQKLACIKHEMLISAVATGNCRQLFEALDDLSAVGRALRRRALG